MEPIHWALIAAGAVILLVLIVLAIRTRRHRKAKVRTGELRDRFGPEYERMVDDRGRDDGERELESRVERYRRSPARPLTPEDRRQVMTRWSELQASYVDDPAVAIQRAEVLLRTILERREVPYDRVDDRVTAAAFIRPGLADQYRRAHKVFVDVEADRAGPEHEHDQRMAFLVYRELILDYTQERVSEEPQEETEVRVADLTVTTGPTD